MKKIFTFSIMILVIFVFSSCTPDDISIKLSVNNYETYLHMDIFFLGDDAYINSEYDLLYRGVKGEVEVRPVSTPNYEFIDVVFTIQIIGEFTIVEYDSKPKKTFNKIIEVILDIDGYGNGFEIINIKDIYYSNYANDINFESYEIISVSGTVKENNFNRRSVYNNSLNIEEDFDMYKNFDTLWDTYDATTPSMTDARLKILLGIVVK